MTIWMKNFGLSLKLGPATDLLLENTRINFQSCKLSAKQEQCNKYVTCHTWQSAVRADGREDSE
jgi:hypothetical protein